MKKLLCLFALCGLMSSCVTDMKLEELNGEINVGTSLGLPIGSVHANMLYLLDFVDSTYVSTDSTNAICLLYNQENINLDFKLDTIFRKGEYLSETLTLGVEPCFQEIFNNIPSSVTKIPLPMGSYKFSRHTKYDLNFNHIEDGEIIQIDSARIQSANVDFKIKVQGVELSEETFLRLSFHYPCLLDEEYEHAFENIDIKKNEEKFSKSLSRFMAHFDELEDGNLIDLAIDFEIISNDPNTTISRNAKLTFETEINLIKAYEGYGFIWAKDPIAEDSVSYEIPQDIFENDLLANNKLLFANPEITIKATTNAGLPLALSLENVYAQKGDRIEFATFNGQYATTQTLNTPKQEYDSATTTITLNREYGSLHTLLSMLPETINLNYKVTTPQVKKDPENPQFMTLPVLARLDLQAKLPLQFDPTTKFTYKDTLDADIAGLLGDGIMSAIDIDTICIYLDVNSSLPANASIKLGYLDETGTLLKESNKFMIQSAQVDMDGRVQTPTQQTIELSTTGDAIEDVYNTKQIVFEIGIEGYDENSKIYFESTNALDIDVSAFASVKANLNLSGDEE